MDDKDRSTISPGGKEEMEKSDNKNSQPQISCGSTQKIEFDLAGDSKVVGLLSGLTETSWKKKLALAIIPGLTFFAGMVSVASGLWINVHDRRQQLEIKMISLQVERLRDEKNSKIKLEREFNWAGVKMRAIRNLEIKACTLGVRKASEEKFKFEEMRMDAREQVARTFYGMKSVFKDVSYIVKEAKKLISFDESIADICDGPPEENWLVLQVKVSNMMEKSIYKSDNELKALENKLNSKIKEGWF